MRAKLGCPVVVRYASTESCVATGTRLDDTVDVICTTVGRPNGDVELRLVDDAAAPITGHGPDARRHRVPARPGARCAATGTIRNARPRRSTRDGWLHTGDLGWLGDDGNLRLAGRSTEMYIRGGNNVYPIEVENCLGDHPDIAATALLGVAGRRPPRRDRRALRRAARRSRCAARRSADLRHAAPRGLQGAGPTGARAPNSRSPRSARSTSSP